MLCVLSTCATATCSSCERCGAACLLASLFDNRGFFAGFRPCCACCCAIMLQEGWLVAQGRACCARFGSRGYTNIHTSAGGAFGIYVYVACYCSCSSSTLFAGPCLGGLRLLHHCPLPTYLCTCCVLLCVNVRVRWLCIHPTFSICVWCAMRVQACKGPRHSRPPTHPGGRCG